MFEVPRRGPRAWLLPLIALMLTAGAGAALGVRSVTPATPAAAAEAPPVRPPLTAEAGLPLLGARLEAAAARGFMGGVLVARGDEVLFRQVYGPADVRTGAPLKLDSRFLLASVSKQFTAAAILRLQDEGVLKVSDPVCRWIQPCPEAWAGIRLEHLLTHTSGIPDLMARPGWGLARVTPKTLSQLTADSAGYGLQFQPGEKVRYDNAAYNLLADVVERASGRPYLAYLDEAFFQPLNLNIGYGEGARARDVVTGHARFPAGLTPQIEPNLSIVIGAGALAGDLDDLFLWTRALHDGRVLSGEGYAAMTSGHVSAGATRRRDWGYGLAIGELGSRVSPGVPGQQIYHTGSWSGFRNLVTYHPDSEVTVVVLTNNYHQRDEVLLITQQALAETLGLPIPGFR
ncbi:MAG TPA: serine hydrolase domain-containing protein [Brevundimonas sp.]|jgi:CubicO group peptidase (beta-lactamase class C family)|uniref:serine hydrolase domain-containing protein n=1 Tax=Brevundimonas sp. TaxID=1871086 RepID=UPI002E0DADDB|nr:serine hydrolase domain-containing protein [Brevundimonas sp.]